MGEKISTVVPDWSREIPRKLWDPGRRLLRSIRKYQECHAKGTLPARLLKKYWVLQYRFWSAICGAEIGLQCEIGGGLVIPHPNGIVIHHNVKIGVNCLIFQQVTLGMRNGEVPCIGGHVDIGAGAKILGNIKVGDNARIGANAVVIESVPPASSVVGVPAKLVRK